ncbi:type II secretion system protein E [Pandoraea cepalis]|uniref:Type II secretion system protein E n=1 Tax=Pandoraea cepalis TaxID=2508294 RepID=A0AAW7MH92_9BURK|nr:ATPase, T2SS/T4P/T4SS family [Pandoraea cepalis]MDN4572031.1 type II secretion system protein E [Pandoraea cepalis]MDN4576682.1 type II secretion system protein E [Pandoraea cepalis]
MDRAPQAAVSAPKPSVISLPGSEYAPPPAIADKLVLLSDGILLVNSSYLRDMSVMAYCDSLRRSGLKHEVKSATNFEIAAYRTSGARVAADGQQLSSAQARLVELMRQANQERASDLHFVNYERETLVRWRVHNSLITRHTLTPTDGQEMCRALYESMTDDADTNYNAQTPQDGRVSSKYLEGVGLQGARIATRPMEYANLMVMRLFRRAEDDDVTSLEQAGYTSLQRAILHRLLRRKGIVLFSGETGSGKSSSLAILMRILLEMFHYRIHLLTIEHPLEKVIKGAVQTVLTGDLSPEGLSRAWASAIANSVRLDIDYLMVGELRDLTSAVAAISGALTGHGLFSTIHADEIFAILDRLFDFGISERRLVNPKLFSGLVNQALAPILCPSCSEPFAKAQSRLDEVTRERVREFCTPDTVRVRGVDVDCSTCGGLGYVGRKVVAEVCMTNSTLLNVYRDDGSAAARKHWIEHMDGYTKCAHVIQRINDGHVDPFDGDSIVPLDEDKIILG